MSTLASGRSENSWDGDVQFLAGDNSILDIGLHPELQRLAVKNEVFGRGSEDWGYNWVDEEYPNVNKDLEREYTFNFDVSNRTLVVTCEGEVSTQVYTVHFILITCQSKLQVNDI